MRPRDHTVVIVLLRALVVVQSATEKVMFRPTFVQKLMSNYDRIPPPGGAAVVKLGIYINSIYAINEQTMDYSLSIYLRQQWNDSRLKFNPADNYNKTKVKLEDYMWDHIWVPDVFLRNEKKASFHYVTTPNRLLFLFNTGVLWYVSKVTTTLTCPMRLEKYPLDSQECPMHFESFGYTMNDIEFRWLPQPVEYEKNLELPQFNLLNHTLKDCSQNYTTGAYPCLSVNFLLQRDIGYYMIQLYIPSVLIVILSWVSFWLNVDAAPARVSIGLLTVLTTTTMSTGARDQLPRVSYIKAIDVWMSACLIFVFISLLEYAVVSVYSRKQYKNRSGGISTFALPFWRRTTVDLHVVEDIPLYDMTHQQHRQSLYDMNQVRSQIQVTTSRVPVEVTTSRVPVEGRQTARTVDKISRILFPLVFVGFNLAYWLFYFL